MITRDEILAKSDEFAINPSDVQRDYVFGWLLAGTFNVPAVRDAIVLKGGNALRKGYFPTTRFSDDLDFSTERGFAPEWLLNQFNDVCRLAEGESGVHFDLDRNRIADVHQIDRERQVVKLRLYFQDFSGSASHITLAVRIDVTEYDRLILPPQIRRLIHPYSDVAACSTEIRCVALEEALGDKLKCLLQRRHSHDLFDLLHGTFVNQDLDVDRGQIVRVFLQKTIFGPSPIAAKNLLLGTPFHIMRGFWDRLVCPQVSRLSFDAALAAVRTVIEALFEQFNYGGHLEQIYFPSEFRNPILEAGGKRTLLRYTYQGMTRLVEPYSLVFKRRQDGVAREYFFGFDRTGGNRSGPGIKSLVAAWTQRIEMTDEVFEPRYEIELAKAGDRAIAGYFSGNRSGGRAGVRSRGRRSLRSGVIYRYQCRYCGRTFEHTRPSATLHPHLDGYGNRCRGRSGHRV